MKTQVFKYLKIQACTFYGNDGTIGKRASLATQEGPREGVARTKQAEVAEATAEAAEATKVIEAGDRARAQMPAKEDSTPIREDTSTRRLPKEVAEAVASRARRIATTRSRQ